MKVLIGKSPVTGKAEAFVRSGTGIVLTNVSISSDDHNRISEAVAAASAAATVEYPANATGRDIAAIDDALEAAVNNLKRIANDVAKRAILTP